MTADAERFRRFKAQVTADPRGRGVVQIPFDPDAAWGAKKEHLVGGKIDGRQVRGAVVRGSGGWVLTLGPMWMRDAGVADGTEVVVRIAPEGPLRQDLADDFAAALAANPAAADFYDTLAQFYRRAYLRWIDATVRRPELRPVRIAEVVELLAAGSKERPR
jgi:hypothetical protein